MFDPHCTQVRTRQGCAHDVVGISAGCSMTGASLPPSSSGIPAVPFDACFPSYGKRSLAELLPSVASAMGVSRFSNTLEIAAASRMCVLLVDGLGWRNLLRERASAPFMSQLIAQVEDDGSFNGRGAGTTTGLGSYELGRSVMTAGFPTTTSVSLTSLGTGSPSGYHGLVGYALRVPGSHQLMNLLRWNAQVEPERWQPHPTMFQRLATDDIACFHVAAGAFRNSGLTRAAFRGARFWGVETPGDLISAAAAATRAAPRSLVVAYAPDLDRTGHLRGCYSLAWREQLAMIDRMAERLVAALPEGSLFVITGDHGMVDVAKETRIDLDAPPYEDLSGAIAMLGGEPRMRHLYAQPGAAKDLLAGCRELFADRVWTLERDEAISLGLFGASVSQDVAGRMGDLLVLSGPTTALVASTREHRESRLIGMHGSLSADEQHIPLLIVPGGEG